MLAGWKYIDPVEATVRALRDYRNMERLFQTGRKRLLIRENEKAEDSKEEKKGEAEEFDWYSPERRFEGRQWEAFREAEAYMKWFMPAWKAMAREDREKLSTYFDRTYGQYVTVHIAGQTHADPSAICRRRRGAVRKPALLYGSSSLEAMEEGGAADDR